MKKTPKYLAGYTGERCFLCGRNGTAEPLDHHHIFNGAYRKKSERYGLVVQLCMHSCHNGGPDSVHRNQDVDRRLKQMGQRKAMEENGWSTQEFIRIFGKNYLDEEDSPTEEPAAIRIPAEEKDQEERSGILTRLEVYAAAQAKKRRERQKYGQLDLFAFMA